MKPTKLFRGIINTVVTATLVTQIFSGSAISAMARGENTDFPDKFVQLNGTLNNQSYSDMSINSTRVNNEAGFVDAISKGNSVILKNDINLHGDSIKITDLKSLVIDLNEHTLTLSQEYSGFILDNSELAIINGTIAAGTNSIEHAAYIKNRSSLFLNGVNVRGFTNSAILSMNSELTIESSNFAENKSKGDGAAIKISEGEFFANGNNTFTENSAAYNGGAIFFDKVVNDINLSNATFNKNTSGYESNYDVWGSGGGAIYVMGNNNLSIGDNVVFSDNCSNTSGGAILFKGQKLIVNGGTFSNNIATNHEGGAIAVIGNYRSDFSPSATNEAVLTKGTFTGNKTGYKSDGITPNGNYQDWGGGAIFVDDASSMTVPADTVITGNTAGGFGGGIAGCSTGRVFIFGDENSKPILFNNNGGAKNNIHVSGTGSMKQADHEYALNNDTFMENGYDDFFCALNSTVAKKVFGDAVITGSIDHAAINTDDEYFVATYSTGISARLDNTTSVPSEPSVRMENNTSYTHGGAILCNGYLVVGDPASEKISVGKSLELNASKAFVKDGSNEEVTLKDKEFGFKLENESGEVVLTGKNDASGKIAFDNRLVFDKTNWQENENHEFTYYLSEIIDTESEQTIFDESKYTIKITVTKKDSTASFGALDLNKENYEIATVSILKDDEVFNDFYLDKSDEMHPAVLTLNNSSSDNTNVNTYTFVNKLFVPEEPTTPEPDDLPPEEPTTPDEVSGGEVTPGNAQTPNEPSTPDEVSGGDVPSGDTPTPEEPSTPDEVSGGDVPSGDTPTPEEPSIPEEVADGDTPTPEEPSTPDEVSGGDVPSGDTPTPEEPSIPEEVADGDTPTPEEPSIPEDQVTPEPPVTPDSPATPESTTEPDTPDIPNTPNNPTTVENEESPKNPTNPNQPETPENDNPEQPKNNDNNDSNNESVSESADSDKGVLGAIRERVLNNPLVLGARRALTSDDSSSIFVRILIIAFALVLLYIHNISGKRRKK